QPAARQPGSLLENAISQVDSLDKISRLPNPEEFGETEEERLLNIGLELGITWINRILFLKLLEAQIIRYHRGDKSLGFLNLSKIADYDDLNRLFFSVLAKKQSERSKDIQNIYTQVPYLNSSLFEPTELEQSTIVISNLRSENLEIFAGTVLKDSQGKKRTGEINALAYLFEFLNAYDFSSEGGEAIQEDNKTLINASVLGLIFEKINGYKDGSFFTPGFITMYMCRETIRRAVIEKFNQSQGWDCQTIEDVYNRIKDKTAANAIINSLKICDPAVGSGHFLVSALNEIIAIKSELQILVDKEGKTLRDYRVEVVNDELIVTDDDGNLFEYNPRNRESQRVQETLFQEKQRLIEGCLFGVDINPNSVKICRLRLWIELLKNAYYKADNELETLPNIDINIKVGNSLISRFGLSNDLQVFSRKNRLSIESYKDAVRVYRNAEDKSQKREMERLISEIKSSFRQTLQLDNPLKKRLRGLETDLYSLENQILLFEESPKEKKARERKIIQLRNEIDKLRPQLEEIESGKIYHNAFEWRFEFPEVLDDKGNFIGFDVIIGNPPYIRQEELKNIKPILQNNFVAYSGTADLYVFFVELGFKILNEKGNFCYILPNKWMQAGYGTNLRKLLLKNQLLAIIDFGSWQLFDEATTYPCIIRASKYKNQSYFLSAIVKNIGFKNNFKAYLDNIFNVLNIEELDDNGWIISPQIEKNLLIKIGKKCVSLDEYIGKEAHYGIKTGLTEAFFIDNEIRNEILIIDPKSSEILKPVLRGRTIDKWYTLRDDLWLISTFPALNIDIDSYPAIKEHLLKFGRERLEQSGKKGSRKKSSNRWFETQDNIRYWQEFEKPKIMYQSFQTKPCFMYDEQGLYCNNSMWIISKPDKFLLGILNSKMGWWLISKYCTAIQNGYQLIWQYFRQILIPIISQEQQQPIIALVDQILTAKKSNPKADTSELEKEIDKIVYELYGLSEEEIRIIEGEIK
ncbi:MAG: class I SAM-dependent DNA methyltransferase, partial [Microcystis sp.]|uniref:class I SAM-dependent DNA methyltransferase n=1 Tax=Microcystis sp. TaxID=1127 RepID=UPI00391DDF5C